MAKISFKPKLGSKKHLVLGLDIGSYAIKLVELQSAGSQLVVRRIGQALVPSQAIVDGSIKEPEQVANSLNALLANTGPRLKQAGTSIAGYSVIVKKIGVPYEDEKEIENNLIFEAEKYVPFEIEDVYVDFYILPTQDEKADSGETEIFLVAAKREVVDEYAHLIQEVGLSPAVVDVDGFCLGNAFEGTFGVLPESVAIIDIGAHKTNLNIIGNGTSLFSRDMAFGGAQLTEAISDATGLNMDEAEQAKISGTDDPELRKEIAEICKELSRMWAAEQKKAIEFFNSNMPADDHPTHVFLTGGTALMQGIDKLFTQEIGLSTKKFDPLKGFAMDPSIDPEYASFIAPQMAIATGLALRTVSK